MKQRLIKVENDYRLLDKNNSIIGTTDLEYQQAFSDVCQKLSIKNCEVVENGYNLDELSLNFVSRDGLFVRNPYNEAGWIAATNGFVEGFQKALEILKEKNKELYEFARDCATNWDCDKSGHIYDTPCRMCDAKNLLKQTEWDVIIEMENYELSDDHGNSISCERPKLDANGCITLKRKV